MVYLYQILQLEPVAGAVLDTREDRLPLAGLASSSKQLRDLVSSLALVARSFMQLKQQAHSRYLTTISARSSCRVP
jgi:hypothetical protein